MVLRLRHTIRRRLKSEGKHRLSVGEFVCSRYVSGTMNTFNKWREKLSSTSWPVIALLLLFILLFVGRAFLPDKVLMPLDLIAARPPWRQPNQAVDVHNPLLTDVVDYIYPVKEFAAEQVKQGNLPLWNPYVLAGYPLTYNTQAALFYPLSILYYLLPPVTAVDLTILLQMVLGGIFMIAYLRLLRLRRLAALSGAVLFLFNGMMVAWLEWQVVHAAVIWLPLQLYLIERAAQKLKSGGDSPLPDAALAGIAFALPWLGGHWNWTLYGSMTAALYWVWRFAPLLLQGRRDHNRQLIKLVLQTAVLLFGIGIGLSLIQVLPAFNYLRQGHRQAFTFNQSLSLGLKEWAVVALVPDFFGSPIHKNWWGGTNYNEIALYLGVLPLFFIAIAILLRRTAVTKFYMVWGGLGLLWALGTPAYGMLFVLPVFNGLWPSRAITIVVFCGAVLAAFGVDSLLQPTINKKAMRSGVILTAVFLITLLAAYLWFYRPDLGDLQPDLLFFALSLLIAIALLMTRAGGRLDARPFALLVVLWLAVDLFWTGWDYNTIGDIADLYPQTETAIFLQSDAEPSRITTLPVGVAYPPNTFLPDRLQAINGYEPAILQSWVNYISAAEGGEAVYYERKLMPLKGLDSPLLDAINLKYVVTIADWYQEVSTAGPEQEPGDEWMSLESGAVSFPITMPEAGLHRIDLPLRAGDGAAGTITMRVFTTDGQQELAHASWDIAEPPDDGWVSFFFGAFPSDWGRDFSISLAYDGEEDLAVGASEQGPAFRTFYLPRPQLAHEDNAARVYLNDGYFPRAYLVPRAVAARDGAEALALVEQAAGQLDQVVILETGDDWLPPEEAGTGVTGTAAITTYETDRVILEANLETAAFLVLADTFYPGWRATIDGEPTAIYRANSVVRAVALPAGRHTITFTFLPIDFLIGSAVSGLVLLLATGLLLYWRQTSRKKG